MPANKINLLFVQKSAGRGGAKNCLLDTLAALATAPEVTSRVITAEPGPLADECRAMGIEVEHHPLPEWRKWKDRIFFNRSMRRTAKHYRDHDIDFVLSNEMWWAPQASRLASHLGARSAVFLRDGIATPSKAAKYALARNDLILPSSSTIAEPLQSVPALRDRVRVLFDHVRSPSHPSPETERIIRELQTDDKITRWIVVIGKVGPRKNQVDAIRTLRHLHAAGLTEYGLVLAGDCDEAYRPAIDAAIAESNFKHAVRILGNFDDPAALYAIADTVLLTSTREGLPRSIVEGLLARKPCFMYPCEGAHDVFREESPRFVSDTMTPDSIAPLLVRFFQDRSLAEPALEGIYDRIQDQFSAAAHRDALLKLLREKLNAAPA